MIFIAGCFSAVGTVVKSSDSQPGLNFNTLWTSLVISWIKFRKTHFVMMKKLSLDLKAL